MTTQITPLFQQDVILKGKNVLIRPIKPEDWEGIFRAAREGNVFQHMSSVPILTIEDARLWMDVALAAKAKGTDYPFVYVDQRTGEIVGSTRFIGIDDAHKKVEIGSTWLVQRLWGTHFNTECKYLLLTFVFETLGYYRAQLVTDSLNIRSQKAIEKIGATKEGVLRNFIIRRNGTHRDTVVYSIIFQEWENVKQELKKLLAAV